MNQKKMLNKKYPQKLRPFLAATLAGQKASASQQTKTMKAHIVLSVKPKIVVPNISPP